MTTITEKLAARPAGATEAQVEQLAHERYTAGSQASRADSTYFLVLLVACQAKLGGVKRGPGRRPALDSKTQLGVLEAAHERFYAAVLRGVTTPDVAADDTLERAERQRRMLERNARSGFARSAKSSLWAYAEAGGDLRTLDPATTTKTALRAALAPAEPTDKVARQIARSEGALIRAVQRQARASPDTAAGTIERLIGEFQKLMDDLGTEDAADLGGTTTVTAAGTRGAQAPQRTRVGVPMLNRPQAGAA